MSRLARNLLFLLTATTFFSCGKDFRIEEEHFGLIPYEGNEILVFQSDQHDRDTIFLQGFLNYTTPLGTLDLFPDKHEVHSLSTKKSDPNYDRYLEGKGLIELIATETGTSISFDIAMKRSWYYGKNVFKKSEFDSLPETELRINEVVYTDVKVFESDGSYIERDNYAERFYWSVKSGFLGLDRKGEKWRLIQKYIIE